MKTPGIDIRPLRELTGQAMFNEVFFDDVFVPDDCLVGPEHDGWRCAAHDARERARVHGRRATRSAAGSSACCARSRRAGRADDTLALAEAGDLVVDRPRARGARLPHDARRRCAGADPSGSEAAVRKLLGVQHDQRVQEVGMVVMGADAAVADGDAAAWVGSFLFNRCLTIAGGTSDIQRNVIAERLLGLPARSRESGGEWKRRATTFHASVVRVHEVRDGRVGVDRQRLGVRVLVEREVRDRRSVTWPSYGGHVGRLQPDAHRRGRGTAAAGCRRVRARMLSAGILRHLAITKSNVGDRPKNRAVRRAVPDRRRRPVTRTDASSVTCGCTAKAAPRDRATSPVLARDASWSRSPGRRRYGPATRFRRRTS